ncbi:MAG: hypothetical protein ABEI11_01800 [Haloarculaceae archaeon]
MATASGDMEVGLGLALGLLGIVGALAMLVTGFTGQQLASGWGFALAMAAGALAIVVVHVYD